jgi:hypothetical protein
MAKCGKICDLCFTVPTLLCYNYFPVIFFSRNYVLQLSFVLKTDRQFTLVTLVRVWPPRKVKKWQCLHLNDFCALGSTHFVGMMDGWPGTRKASKSLHQFFRNLLSAESESHFLKLC